jgi:DNA-binding NarL/FixJ family response regulator
LRVDGERSKTMKILAAIQDLMFSSKVTANARGRPIEWLKRGTKVVDQVAASKPDVLLIDLASPQLDAVNAIREIKSGEGKQITVIGYVDHTRADLIEAARAAGCDQVMSKGEFARRLPELLEGI